MTQRDVATLAAEGLSALFCPDPKYLIHRVVVTAAAEDRKARWLIVAFFLRILVILPDDRGARWHYAFCWSLHKPKLKEHWTWRSVESFLLPDVLHTLTYNSNTASCLGTQSIGIVLMSVILLIRRDLVFYGTNMRQQLVASRLLITTWSFSRCHTARNCFPVFTKQRRLGALKEDSLELRQKRKTQEPLRDIFQTSHKSIT